MGVDRLCGEPEKRFVLQVTAVGVSGPFPMPMYDSLLVVKCRMTLMPVALLHSCFSVGRALLAHLFVLRCLRGAAGGLGVLDSAPPLSSPCSFSWVCLQSRLASVAAAH